MEEDLYYILANPFRSGSADHQKKAEEEESPDAILHKKALDLLEERTAQNAADLEAFQPFRRGLHEALNQHQNLYLSLQKILFSTESLTEKVGEAVPGMKRNIDDLMKSYKIYIVTSSEDTLKKEALRLERKFFDQPGKHGQINFIKLKRYYEKLKTFNEQAKSYWKDIIKGIDALSISRDLAEQGNEARKLNAGNIYRLIRTTDAYLEALRSYIPVESENYDPITRSWQTGLTFTPGRRYTLWEFFNDKDPDEEEAPEEEEISEEQEDVRQDFEGSIAKSIVLETLEHKLNSASIISVPILGSKDWNRTPDYKMEVSVKEYDDSLDKFRIAFHVIVDEATASLQFSQMDAANRKGFASRYMNEYVILLTETLDRIISEIVIDDYPGLEKPRVFLYHCGPNVLFRILMADLQKMNRGELFYQQSLQTTVREYPVPFIKKELIGWWKTYFSEMDGSEIDSYVIYSRLLEMIKKDYRILYEEGIQMKKSERSKFSILGIEQWLRDHRNRVFGHRKTEIFRRFLKGTVFDADTDHTAVARLLTAVRAQQEHSNAKASSGIR